MAEAAPVTQDVIPAQALARAGIRGKGWWGGLRPTQNVIPAKAGIQEKDAGMVWIYGVNLRFTSLVASLVSAFAEPKAGAAK